MVLQRSRVMGEGERILMRRWRFDRCAKSIIVAIPWCFIAVSWGGFDIANYAIWWGFEIGAGRGDWTNPWTFYKRWDIRPRVPIILPFPYVPRH